MKKQFLIPIYDVTLYVVVTDDIAKARKAMDPILGGPATIDLTDSNGLASHDRSDFAVFFDEKSLTPKLVAHEVYHVTGMILHHVGSKISGRFEHAALLHGYLFDLVSKAVRNGKVDMEKKLLARKRRHRAKRKLVNAKSVRRHMGISGRKGSMWRKRTHSQKHYVLKRTIVNPTMGRVI